MALDLVLVKGSLEDLIVFDVFMFMLRLPSDLLEREGAGIQAVENRAVDCTCRALFDLCELELQSLVNYIPSSFALTPSSSLNQFKIATLPTK